MQRFCILIRSGSKFITSKRRLLRTRKIEKKVSGQPLRFLHLNSEDLDSLLEERNSTNTNRVTNSSVAVLKKFCDETDRDLSDLYCNSNAELKEILKLFYGGLRNSDGAIS